MTRRSVQLTWFLAVIVWVVICSTAWFAATRGDYAKLNAAIACVRVEPRPAAPDPRCVHVKPSDMFAAKAAIDRKARISRLAAAFGTAAAFAVWFLLGRPGLNREQ